MSDSAKGKIVSIETRLKMSEARKGKKRDWRPNAEQRAKMSFAKKGKKLSIDTRELIRKSQLKRWSLIDKVNHKKTIIQQLAEINRE